MTEPIVETAGGLFKVTDPDDLAKAWVALHDAVADLVRDLDPDEDKAEVWRWRHNAMVQALNGVPGFFEAWLAVHEERAAESRGGVG